MNDQAIRFRFGIFVLASLILLAVLTILFGGFPNYFKRSDTYLISFDNASGVAPGTPVRRSGVRIGEVRSIVLNDETGKVLVEITVDEKYSLRKGDRPTLLQGLLGGDASIAFLPPEDKKLDDPTRVPPGARLEGVTPADAGTLMQKTADLVQPAQEVLLEVRKVFVGINKIAPVVEETLKDFREIGKMVRTIGPDLQKTSEEIRLLSMSTREMIPEIKKTNDEIQITARNWGKVAPDIQKTSEDFRLLSKNVRDMIPELKRTNEEVQITARNWGKVGERVDVLLRTNEDKIVKSIERAEDTLKRINTLFSDENQKLINDTLKNVRNGSQQLESIAKDTSELIKDSRGTVKQLSETLKRADDALSDIQKTIKPFGEKGPGIFKNFDESSENLNKTLKDMRELIQMVARSDGTVQKLLSDPSLYNNMNDSALMVAKILPRLDRIMRDMETFADKLARHPELLGIRGAIVPSLGLKESPSAIPYRVYP